MLKLACRVIEIEEMSDRLVVNANKAKSLALDKFHYLSRGNEKLKEVSKHLNYLNKMHISKCYSPLTDNNALLEQITQLQEEISPFKDMQCHALISLNSNKT